MYLKSKLLYNCITIIQNMIETSADLQGDQIY